MKDVAASEVAQSQDHTPPPNPVGGPVKAAWREGTLTRAKEIEALRAWVLYKPPPEHYRDLNLSDAICWHLTAARDAATGAKLNPPNKFLWMFRSSSRFERAMSNLDAAESQLLNIAPNFVTTILAVAHPKQKGAVGLERGAVRGVGAGFLSFGVKGAERALGFLQNLASAILEQTTEEIQVSLPHSNGARRTFEFYLRPTVK